MNSTTAQIPLTTAIATEKRIFDEATRRLQKLERSLESQTARADYLLWRKDEMYALLMRVRLCRDLFEQLPTELREDVRAITGDLTQ